MEDWLHWLVPALSDSLIRAWQNIETCGVNDRHDFRIYVLRYQPKIQWADGAEPQAALTAALRHSSGFRGFSGSLKNLRTPHGLATITASATGLAIAPQK